MSLSARQRFLVLPCFQGFSASLGQKKKATIKHIILDKQKPLSLLFLYNNAPGGSRFRGPFSLPLIAPHLIAPGGAISPPKGRTLPPLPGMQSPMCSLGHHHQVGRHIVAWVAIPVMDHFMGEESSAIEVLP